MRSTNVTWFYVSLDAGKARPSSIRVLGEVETPAGTSFLVEGLSKRMFNVSKLLLVPSRVLKDQGHLEPGALTPVRAYDGGSFVAGQSLSAEEARHLAVLDIGGITQEREVAELWARK